MLMVKIILLIAMGIVVGYLVLAGILYLETRRVGKAIKQYREKYERASKINIEEHMPEDEFTRLALKHSNGIH